jgi:hypothetical protein
MIVFDRSEMTGMVALHVKLAKMDGYTFYKKATRYNSIVDYMLCCACCGDVFNEKIAWSAMDDGILDCTVEGFGADYPFDRNNFRWMENCSDSI